MTQDVKEMHKQQVVSPAGPVCESVEGREWKTSMWDCCHTDTLLHCALWCCLGSLGGGIAYALLLQKQGKDTCNVLLGCCLITCFQEFACCIAGPNRKEIRNKYGLKEEPCGDICVHFCGCCTPCAVCQEFREVEEGYNSVVVHVK